MATAPEKQPGYLGAVRKIPHQGCRIQTRSNRTGRGGKTTHTAMLHPDLYNALKSISERVTPDMTPAEAWDAIKPAVAARLIGPSFWTVLGRRMPMLSNIGQRRLAEYIFRCQSQAKKAGRAWPPVALIRKDVIFQPTPTIL